MKRLANRTRELEFFLKMLRGESAARILLVQAQSGYGKTNLMSRFADQCPNGTIVVPLDLKTSGGEEITYVLNRIREALERYRFQEYEAAIERVLKQDKAVLNIENNVLSGNGSFILAMVPYRLADRQSQLEKVQSAFFRDLKKVKLPIVFLLDTFNEATKDLKGWIAGHFLAEVAKNSQLFCVVAGQQVPKPSIEWEGIHHHCCLQPIRKYEDWYEYAWDEGYGFDQKELNFAIDLGDGDPSQIVKALQLVRLRRQSL